MVSPSRNTNRRFCLQRSQLSVPAVKPELFPKAMLSAADAIMLDCEDSVPYSQKEVARSNTIQTLKDLDWDGTGKHILVRVNGPDTHSCYRDVIEIVEAAADRFHGLVLPKVESEDDVRFLHRLLEQIESGMGVERPLGIEVLVETAAGITNLDAIAASSNRLEAIHFGAGDFAASIGLDTLRIGTDESGFEADPLYYPMQRIVIACRTCGLRAIDSAFGDFTDEAGLNRSLQRAVALGFDGKWAIHPAQIEPVNRSMTPAPERVEQARKIVHLMDEASRGGTAALNMEGQMIDLASVRMARQLLVVDEAIQLKMSANKSKK